MNTRKYLTLGAYQIMWQSLQNSDPEMDYWEESSKHLLQSEGYCRYPHLLQI